MAERQTSHVPREKRQHTHATERQTSHRPSRELLVHTTVERQHSAARDFDGKTWFWFLHADEIRKSTAAKLPKWQDLQHNHPDWIVRKPFTINDVISGKRAADVCTVSHRWEEADDPDSSGEQMRTLRQFLLTRTHVKLVWIDYCCMPQAPRTLAEKTQFDAMLPNVNLLYLGSTVLILLDMIYMSRFWTQFEAWLSMQRASSEGLVSSHFFERRCSVVCIHNAAKVSEQMADALIRTWATRSTAEAVEILLKPDVQVTNQRDKVTQLDKIAQIDAVVRTAVDADQSHDETNEWLTSALSQAKVPRMRRGSRDGSRDSGGAGTESRLDYLSEAADYHPRISDWATPALVAQAESALTSWRFDVGALDEASRTELRLPHGCCLTLLVPLILHAHDLLTTFAIEPARLHAFLRRMESTQRSHDYHNAVYFADATLTMHLLLSHYPALAKRLTKLETLAALLAALLHDFDHPGTTNAFEVRRCSPLATLHSDSSVLERHHLARAFDALKREGDDFLQGMAAADFRECRAIVIELVLRTDLAAYFEFSKKLQRLATRHGYATYSTTAGKGRELRRALTRSFAKAAKGKFWRCWPKRRVEPAVSSGDTQDTPSPNGPSSSRKVAPAPASEAVEKEEVPSSDPERVSTSSSSDVPKPPALSRQSTSGSSFVRTQRRSFLFNEWVTPFADPTKTETLDLLTLGINFANVCHVIKPWELHKAWSQRVQEQFFKLGDVERPMVAAGELDALSPLCDRRSESSLARSQMGFFKVVCAPFYDAVAQLIDPQMPPIAAFHDNFEHWAKMVKEEDPDESTVFSNKDATEEHSSMEVLEA